MSKEIKIGKGNKIADRVFLAVNLLLLITIQLIFNEARFFFMVLMMGGIVAFNSISIMSKYYVFYSNGYFVIDHVYKKRTRIKSDRYLRVSQNAFAFPFSNTLSIHFKNDLNFRFTGGFQNFRALDVLIKGLVQSEYKGIDGDYA